jgi:hypothetical protein
VIPPKDLEQTYFQPHVHSTFQMRIGDGRSIALELLSVSGLPTTPHAKRAPFALMFRSKERQAFSQQIYTLSHEQLGELEIFLVPLGPDEIGMVYQAVFN